MIGDVAGGEHVIGTGAAVLVHENAIVSVDPALPGEVDHRFDPDAQDNEIAVDAAAISGDGPFDGSASFETRDHVVEDRVDAVVVVNGREDAADVLAEDAKQRRR
jgi:hypothetical protein